jgi:hypothetical protein
MDGQIFKLELAAPQKHGHKPIRAKTKRKPAGLSRRARTLAR